MKQVSTEEIKDIVREQADEIDAFEILPLIDLSEAKEMTLKRIEKGYVPDRYRWSRENTERAYAYKNYRSWARSIIVAAVSYFTGEPYPDDRLFGRIAPYTWRNNYSFLSLKLKKLIQKMQKSLGRPIKAEVISCYTSIPEKVLFSYSGLAQIGKNSVLIHRQMGSFFVVGEALLDLEVSSLKTLPLKQPDFELCGTCTRCIDACPTKAIVERGVVNVNRCFQYLSENLLLIPAHWRERWENRLYGCSTCLEVCPYNQNLVPRPARHALGYVGQGMNLLDLLRLSQEAWVDTFKDNQIARRDRRAIQKNAIIALGNSGYKKALDILRGFLSDEHPLIRAYAAWSIGMTGTKKGKTTLFLHLKRESDNLVRSEIEQLL